MRDCVQPILPHNQMSFRCLKYCNFNSKRWFFNDFYFGNERTVQLTGETGQKARSSTVVGIFTIIIHVQGVTCTGGINSTHALNLHTSSVFTYARRTECSHAMLNTSQHKGSGPLTDQPLRMPAIILYTAYIRLNTRHHIQETPVFNAFTTGQFISGLHCCLCTPILRYHFHQQLTLACLPTPCCLVNQVQRMTGRPYIQAPNKISRRDTVQYLR